VEQNGLVPRDQVSSLLQQALEILKTIFMTLGLSKI
jgi:hypothetical protein